MMPAIMTDKLTRIESGPIVIADDNRAFLASALTEYGESTLRTMRKNLSILIDLAENRPPRVRQLTSEQLEQKLLAFDWSRVDATFVETVRRRAKNRGYSKSTVNSLMVICRRIATQRFIHKQIDANELEIIRQSINKRLKGFKEADKGTKTIPAEDLVKILQACLADDAGMLGLRDYTMISVGLGAGLRAQELVTLRINNLDFEKRQICLVGKGKAERVIVPVAGVFEALQNWITAREPKDGVLFPAFAPHADKPIQGREDQPMSYQGFYDVMATRAIQAGVKRPTPHQLRHTFATNTYLATEDMFGLQAQMGHRNPDTTKRYIDRIAQEQARRKAGQSWALPDIKNKTSE